MSSTAFAMDYSHPMAPKNSTDCVSYATMVLDAVELMREKGDDADTYAERASKGLKNDDTFNDLEKEYMRLLLNDAITWYRSSKYAYDPQMAYVTLTTECEIESMQAQYERDMEHIEQLEKELGR